MNVTCERCNTEYDFDDTLVSGRGTTVKCTNCGHLFKVRKAGDATAAAPEKWVVRTVDGRELQFNALRELQAAITQRSIGREDVLSRGSSRPRRLGAISELEPFFTNTGTSPLLPHTTTSPGLGALGSTTPLAPTRGRSATPVGTPAVTVPASTLPSAHVQDSESVMDSSDMQEDATVVRPPPLDPDVIQAAREMFPPPKRQGEKPAARGTKEASPPPGRVPGAAKEGSPPPGRLPKDAPAHARPPARMTPAKGTSAQHPEHVPPARPPEKPATKAGDSTPPPPKGLDKAPTRSSAKEAAPVRTPDKPARAAAKETPPVPPRRPVAQAPVEPAEEAEASPASATAPVQQERDPGAVNAKPGARKQIPVGFTPKQGNDIKISHVGEEPRFSTPRPTTKRSGGAQRLVAFVAVGVLVFVGVTAVRRYTAKTSSPVASAAPDERIAGFLTEAEKALSEGDLQGAQSQLDKASALAEKDPRIVSDLARLATVQADLKWLRLRLLPAGDPEQPLAKRELDLALDRARKMVDGAQAIAPSDAAVTRRRIDVLRIAGQLPEARKLVSSIGAGAGAQADSALVLAALDLAEEKPSWPSVVERLRTAVVGEHSLGRARSMLIYALVRSGDVAGAKAEYDQLAGMPRPHPLLTPLREFIARAEGPLADAGVDGGELTPEEAIRIANETRVKGDVKRAEEMFKDVLKKNPTNADASAGLADIARSRGDSATAIRYYEQAVKHNSVHLPALTALADMKWDMNDRQTALTLYRRIVENGGSTAYVAHARERLGGPIPEEVYVPPTPTQPTVTAPPVTTEPPTPPPPTATTEPTAPPPATTTPPPPATTSPPIFELDNR